MTELAVSNPTERAQELIRLLTRLTTLFVEETKHFNNRQPHLTVSYQNEKTRLATIYRREAQLLKSDPSRLKGLAPDLKEQLKDTTRQFEKAVAENGIAVEALKVLTEGMVKAIADEAVRQKQADAGYGQSPQSARKIGSIAVNQSA